VSNVLTNSINVVWDAVLGLYRHDAITSASVISFALIFAIFPFVILVVISATSLMGEPFALQLKTDLLEALPDHVSTTIAPELDSVLSARISSGLFTAGVLVILFTVSSLLESIRAALNIAYRLDEPRNIIRRRLGSLLLVLATAGGLILVTSMQILLPLAIPYLDRVIPGDMEMVSVIERGGFIVIPTILVLLTGALHIWLPSKRMSVRLVLPGVLITVILWILTARLFGFYLEQFSTFGATYASLAGVFASMIFFEIGGIVLIFGAEINRAMDHRFSPRP
jgi:membrane protein